MCRCADWPGASRATCVSGNIAVSGEVTKTDINTVSGSVFIDAEGALQTAEFNSVSGAVTLRLDDEYPAQYSVHSISGRVQIDGVSRSKNYSGHAGALSGMFVDMRANSVSGDVSVLRRGGGTPSGGVDTEVEWPNGGVR